MRRARTWLIFIYRVPSEPARKRAFVWRRLTGSALIGLLYGWTILSVVVFSVGIQLLASPFYLTLARKKA
jgi:hypothetical protein